MKNNIFLIAALSGSIHINPNEGDDMYFPGALVIRDLFLTNCINYYPVDDYTELLKEDLNYVNLPNLDEIINILNKEIIARKKHEGVNLMRNYSEDINEIITADTSEDIYYDYDESDCDDPNYSICNKGYCKYYNKYKLLKLFINEYIQKVSLEDSLIVQPILNKISTLEKNFI